MPDWMTTAGNWILDIAKIGAAVLVVYQWFAKPIREMRKDIADVKGDTGDLLCDRLTQAHDYHMRKGYCPQGEKKRLCDLHRRYRDMGRNHLADNYEHDLLGLPEGPKGKEPV